MLKRVFAYGAISGKIHAMLGKSIPESELCRLCSFGSVEELAAYLKASPGWADAMEKLPPGSVNRTTLEIALEWGLWEDYVKLWRFASGPGKQLLRAYARRLEVIEILRFLRYLTAGHPEDYKLRVPAAFYRAGEVRYQALEKAPTYAGLLEAAKGGMFYDTLRRMAPGGEQPFSYTALEIALRKCYFTNIGWVIDENFTKKDAEELRMLTGMHVDYYNMVNLYRAKEYYSESPERLLGYVLPFSGRLRQSELEAMIHARSAGGVMDVIQKGPYRKSFARPFDNIEDIYEQDFLRLSRRCLHGGQPGPFAAIAYLNLREIEQKNLITIIECVRYKVPPERAKRMLITLDDAQAS